MNTSNESPKSVSVEELKARLLELLERVSEGDRIVITDRSEPVAELVPFNLERQILAQLAAAGKLRWSGGRPKGLRGIAAQNEPIAETVLQNRR